MAEKPILFSGPMVRAILRDEKTQTRRVITPQPDITHNGEPYWHVGGLRVGHVTHPDRERIGNNPLACPYGEVGTRLWVRETWRPHYLGDFVWDIDVSYAADGARLTIHDGEFGDKDWNWPKAADIGNVSPLFMPRWASRITLEVTEVRVERLRDISEEDAIAEGVGEFQIGRPFRELELGNGIQAAALALGLASSAKPISRRAFLSGGSAAFAGIATWLRGKGNFPKEMRYKHTFALLWDQVNANRNVCKRCKGFGVVTAWEGSVSAGSLEQTADDCPDCGGVDRSYCWENNPWVWVVKFKRLEESK